MADRVDRVDRADRVDRSTERPLENEDKTRNSLTAPDDTLSVPGYSPMQARSETQVLVDHFINFCRHSTLRAKDANNLCKMIVATTKTVDNRAVYDDVFGTDEYIDWGYVHKIKSNAFGGTPAALRMVQYISFKDAEVELSKASTSERGGAKQTRYLQTFVASLAANHLNMPLQDALRLVVVYNLANMSSTSAMEQFCSSRLQRATEDKVLKVIANIAEQCFQPEDYNNALTWVMRRCVVSPAFQKEIDRVYSEREALDKLMEIKNISVSSGRPRLLERLAAKKGRRDTVSVSTGARGGAGGAQAKSMLSGESMDTFDGWCTRVRFPNTISASLKHRMYVVMAQPHVDHVKVVSQFVNDQLCKAITAQRIANPDDRVIANVIDNLDMPMAPFEELTLFMRSCFRVFPQQNLREMTSLKYMQLYIAAYQHPDIWKECWKQIYPLISYQIIRDVEEFVATHAFNQEAFIQIINAE